MNLDALHPWLLVSGFVERFRTDRPGRRGPAAGTVGSVIRVR
ncbi:hypothetical protein OG244_01025 [Streptomyces brevispora]|nr:hypothetical protein [Streptomyces brevispora]